MFKLECLSWNAFWVQVALFGELLQGNSPTMILSFCNHHFSSGIRRLLRLGLFSPPTHNHSATSPADRPRRIAARLGLEPAPQGRVPLGEEGALQGPRHVGQGQEVQPTSSRLPAAVCVCPLVFCFFKGPPNRSLDPTKSPTSSRRRKKQQHWVCVPDFWRDPQNC